MKTILKGMFLSALCLISLAACGGNEQDSAETASLGDLNLSASKNDITGPDHPNCPGTFDPVCAGSGLTYTNACHADKAGESQWQPGVC